MGENANIDQNFIDTFAPKFTTEISGHKITARYFTIEDWESIKSEFPEWKGFNVGELIGEHGFKAIFEITWLAIKDLNALIPTREHLKIALNSHNFMAWADLWRPAVGLNIAEGDDEDEKKSSNDT